MGRRERNINWLLGQHACLVKPNAFLSNPCHCYISLVVSCWVPVSQTIRAWDSLPGTPHETMDSVLCMLLAECYYYGLKVMVLKYFLRRKRKCLLLLLIQRIQTKSFLNVSLLYIYWDERDIFGWRISKHALLCPLGYWQFCTQPRNHVPWIFYWGNKVHYYYYAGVPANAPKKISGVHKRCWRYIPNLKKSEDSSTFTSTSSPTSPNPEVEAVWCPFY